MRLFLCSFLAIGCLFSVSVGADGPDGEKAEDMQPGGNAKKAISCCCFGSVDAGDPDRREDSARLMQNHGEDVEAGFDANTGSVSVVTTSIGDWVNVKPHRCGSKFWWRKSAECLCVTGRYEDEHSRPSVWFRRVRNFAIVGIPVITVAGVLVFAAWKVFSGEEENTTSLTTDQADTTWAAPTNSTVSATTPPASDTNFSCHAGSSQEVMLEWIANVCGIADLNDPLARGVENVSDFLARLCVNRPGVTCDTVRDALQALPQGSTSVAVTSASTTFEDASDQFTTSIPTSITVALSDQVDRLFVIYKETCTVSNDCVPLSDDGARGMITRFLQEGFSFSKLQQVMHFSSIDKCFSLYRGELEAGLAPALKGCSQSCEFAPHNKIDEVLSVVCDQLGFLDLQMLRKVAANALDYCRRHCWRSSV